MNKFTTLLFSLSVLVACNTPTQQTRPAAKDEPQANAPAILQLNVVNAYPHDTSAYTEGFLVHEGQLYESTGTLPDAPPARRSLFGAVDLRTGAISVKAELDRNKYFGEGISFLKGSVYQLTWKTKVGFIYDAKTFKKTGQFSFDTEGWGMTTDGMNLIMSDGSSNIRYYDPAGFKLLKILGVTDNNGPVGNINELEYINGYIYANIYETNDIIQIDPSSGKVVGRADCSKLKNEADAMYSGSEEMNGIAYDSAAKKIYVTGKLWPRIYEVRFGN